jgi:hypothetical protein
MELDDFLIAVENIRRGEFYDDEGRHVEPVGSIVNETVQWAYDEVARQDYESQANESPHGRPWHVSFHASSFPGDLENPCPRYAVYGLMDIPKAPFDRRGTTIMEAGKDIELNTVRKVRDAGRLPRSNQPGRSSDPEARTPDGKPMPQMGFVDKEHWLTGSVDMPLLPLDWSETLHIVEIKTKHEDQVEDMRNQQRQFDEKHRRQLMCSLGLAHENPGSFLHPTEDKILEPPTTGSIYYLARDTEFQAPVNPRFHEFYFEYDPEFMKKGRETLKKWREHFLKGELPETQPYKNTRSHPLGSAWKWSQGECKFCPVKKACKADHAAGVTELKDSHVITLAQFEMPGYDYEAKRARVFQEWDEKDPLAGSE